MRFGELFACRWRIGNPVPMTDLIHGHAGKGEARFLQEQRMYDRIIENVDGRGVDHSLLHHGIPVAHELKYVGGNPRILTGDGGVEAGAPLLRLAEDALDVVVRYLYRAGPDETMQGQLKKTRVEFGKRRVSQRSWRLLAEFVGITVDLLDPREILEAGHPWFADVSLIGVDMRSLEPEQLLPSADVLVLMCDESYLIVPRSQFREHLEFKGEVSPAGVPNLSTSFLWEERLLTDPDEIFEHTERLYNYVVKCKSGNSDPNTGRRKQETVCQ